MPCIQNDPSDLFPGGSFCMQGRQKANLGPQAVVGDRTGVKPPLNRAQWLVPTRAQSHQASRGAV